MTLDPDPFGAEGPELRGVLPCWGSWGCGRVWGSVGVRLQSLRFPWVPQGHVSGMLYRRQNGTEPRIKMGGRLGPERRVHTGSELAASGLTFTAGLVLLGLCVVTAPHGELLGESVREPCLGLLSVCAGGMGSRRGPACVSQIPLHPPSLPTWSGILCVCVFTSVLLNAANGQLRCPVPSSSDKAEPRSLLCFPLTSPQCVGLFSLHGWTMPRLRSAS